MVSVWLRLLGDKKTAVENGTQRLVWMKWQDYIDIVISKNTPPWMYGIGFAFLVLVLVLIVAGSAIWSGKSVLVFFGDRLGTLEKLGQLGDFFGGHISAFVGSITLLVVLFFSYHQGKQQEQFIAWQEQETARLHERQALLHGINLITQWDIQSPGRDQAMRLLDYYARLAFKSEDKEERLLLLNTVITAQIRKNLQGKNGVQKRKNYPFAWQAIEEIRPFRERDGRAQRKLVEAGIRPIL